MRQMRRNDRQMPLEQAWRVLEQCDHGFLALVDEEGAPYCVPLAFALVGHTLYFHSGRKGRKLDCIRHQARACFSCVADHWTDAADYTVQFVSCVAEGPVRVVQEEAERMQGMRAIAEKYSAEYLDCPAYERTMRGMPAVTMLAMEVQDLCGKATKGPFHKEVQG